MHTYVAELLRYRRYQAHLRLIKPGCLVGRFRNGRFYTVHRSSDTCRAGRKLNTMLRVKNRLAGGY